MFILNGNLKDYGFIENENLRTKQSRTFIYKDNNAYSLCYYYDFEFIVDNYNILTFNTSAYGANEYDLTGFAKILYNLISKGVIKYKGK